MASGMANEMSELDKIVLLRAEQECFIKENSALMESIHSEVESRKKAESRIEQQDSRIEELYSEIGQLKKEISGLNADNFFLRKKCRDDKNLERELERLYEAELKSDSEMLTLTKNMRELQIELEKTKSKYEDEKRRFDNYRRSSRDESVDIKLIKDDCKNLSSEKKIDFLFEELVRLSAISKLRIEFEEKNQYLVDELKKANDEISSREEENRALSRLNSRFKAQQENLESKLEKSKLIMEFDRKMMATLCNQDAYIKDALTSYYRGEEFIILDPRKKGLPNEDNMKVEEVTHSVPSGQEAEEEVMVE